MEGWAVNSTAAVHARRMAQRGEWMTITKGRTKRKVSFTKGSRNLSTKRRSDMTIHSSGLRATIAMCQRRFGGAPSLAWCVGCCRCVAGPLRLFDSFHTLHFSTVHVFARENVILDVVPAPAWYPGCKSSPARYQL
eukprot:1923352-Pyramimonas_sp.AAC.1